MRKLFAILCALCMMQLSAQDPGSKQISLDVRSMPLQEFILLIEKESHTSVFYQSETLPPVLVTLKTDSITPLEALTKALGQSSTSASDWNGSIVLLQDNPLPQQLPNYRSDTLNPETEVIYAEQQYMQGRDADVMESLTVGDPENPARDNARISGIITDAKTGEPLIGATIYIEENKTGTASDQQGYFSISLPPGNYHAEVASMGYTARKYHLEVFGNGRIRLQLHGSSFALEEAVILGDRQMDITRKDPGLEKLTVRSLRNLPAMMGERDIIKISEMLPGIVSVGEGSSGLNVRGGSSDQNAFYINNVPIYNTSHLFGFFPAFNSDMIRDFTIYKGYIPSEFGGRLSSVFDIVSRQGNKEAFRFRGGVNPVSANFTAEGPIKKDKISVLISARSSYSDWILSRLDDPDLRNSSAGFNDFSIVADHQGEKTSVKAFIYASNDRFDLSDLNNYSYNNLGGSVTLNHAFSKTLRLDASLIASNYGFSTTDKQIPSTAYTHDFSINHYEAKAGIRKSLNDKNELSGGFKAIIYHLDRGAIRPYDENSLRSVIDHGKERGLETAVYISDKFDVTPRLTLNGGFRFSIFAPLATKEVYTYQPDQPREMDFIADTLHFAANHPLKWYPSPEFRISASYKTDPSGTIKLAFNQMSQNLFMLSNTIAIAPNTQWKLADYHIAPSKSNQYSAGIFRNLASGALEGSVEFFYKQTGNFTEYRDGADFLNNPLTETTVLQGDHESYGVEMMLRKKTGKFDGWMAYTFSRSFVHIDGPNEWDKINNGNPYPSNYDIPHVFNSVLNYNFSKRIILSGVITYQTGRPATFPVSVYYIEDIATVDYFERNRFRIPDYFRTDLSLTIEGNLRRNKLLHSSWMFSLYNATGRKNAYSVFFVSEKGIIKSYKYSVFGVPFFTATWLFKFGNYATE